MVLRNLIVKLRNEDKLLIGDILKTVGKSKSVIPRILRKLGQLKTRNHQVDQGKLLQGKINGFVINKKRIDLLQQPLSLKEQFANLGIKISITLFPEDLMK